MATQTNPVTTTRLTGNTLLFARLGWLLIFLYVIWKLVLGMPLYLEEMNQVCRETVEICAEGVSPTVEEAGQIVSSGFTLAQYASLALAVQLLGSVVWIGTGLLIFALRSDDWMAILVSVMMLMFSSGSETDPISQAYPQIAWFAQLGFQLQNIFLFLVMGLFPNGRFAPRWLRWYWLFMIFISIFSDGLQQLGLSESTVWGIGWLSFLILGPFSQIYRYRKVSTVSERQQIKWVVYGFALMASLILSGFLLIQLNLLPDYLNIIMFEFFGLLIPLGFGISILRYRLWDVDFIIRRTLVYGALTITVALVFFGGVTLLQQVFGAISGIENSPAAIVISTLTIAALFNRLRMRIQNDIDRRFYRKKYDAQKTLEKFAAAARDEISLDELSDHLLSVVNETMQPHETVLWLKPARKR